MNKITIALVSSLIVVLPIHAQDAKPRYSFKTIATTPIPRDAYFVLLRKATERVCANAHEIYGNMFPDECMKIVNERRDACDKEFYKITPAIVSKRSTHLKIARPYLDCATPGVFCYGIEVKTMEQIYRHCQDPNAVPTG